MLRPLDHRIGALRLLVQGESDVPALGLALDVAQSLADGRQVALVTAGLPIAIEPGRPIVELLNARGEATRSLGELAELFAELEPAQVGAVVVGDTSMLYRATRCSTRRASERLELSSAQWDEIAESVIAACEVLSRRGIHVVWVAPSTRDRGLSDDGDEIVLTTTSPKCWGDLPRQVHVWLELVRERGELGCVVRRDTVGLRAERLEPTADALLQLLRGRIERRAVALTTTLDETSARELAARHRRELARTREHVEVGQQLVLLASLRAQQGPDRWAELLRQWERQRFEVSPDVAKYVDEQLATFARRFEAPWAMIRRFESTDERSTHDPEEALGLELRGPHPREVPSFERVDLAAVLASEGNFSNDWSRARLIGAIEACARSLGVWTRPRLAVIAAACGVPSLGKSWAAYVDEHLVQLLLGLTAMATTAAQLEPRAEVSNVVELPRREVEPQPALTLPSATEFARLERRQASDYLCAVLTAGGHWPNLAELVREAGLTQRSKDVRAWSDAERCAVYALVLGRGLERELPERAAARR